MLKNIIISILLIVSVQSLVIAQDAKKDTIPGTKGKLDIAPETKLERKQEKRLYSFSQFAKESSLFIRQPLKWKGNDWLNLGILVGGTALLTMADEPLRNATQGNQQYYNSFPVEGGRIYGEWYSIAIVAGAFGTYGLIAHDTVAKKITALPKPALPCSAAVWLCAKNTFRSHPRASARNHGAWY